MEMELRPRESFSPEEHREHKVFEALLSMVPGLDARLSENLNDENDFRFVASMIQKGMSGARADDTKALKGAVIEWITPRGETLNPPLARHTKVDRGFNHDCMGRLLCPVELDWADLSTKEKLRSGEMQAYSNQWPYFLYQDHTFNAANPWEGLLRSELLVNGYKYIFTSPSSVEKEPKAARSGNARIHGMQQVPIPSLAYVATQVRFALTSAATFSRSDYITDSESFYTSIVELLEDPEELEHVNSLLTWWNR
ncbi:hypothetical protein PHLCEN_2v9959, partial [Hermanssonia centrifuga]